MTDIEKRLANTEYAFLALWNLLGPTIDPQVEFAIDQMVGDYFDANESLGADFSMTHSGFHTGDGNAEG